MGGDCFGLGELALSLRAGVPPDLLVMNGSNKQPAELTAALEAGVMVNVDDRSELEAIARIAEQLGRPADICLRVLPFSYADPAALEPELAAIAGDRSHDKWGMDRRDDPRGRARGARVCVASPPRAASSRRAGSAPRPRPSSSQSRLIAVCIAELRDRFEWQPELLDFGGGYPHERDPGERRTLGQPHRRQPGRVRGGDHVDAAGGARGATRSRSRTSCSSPAGGSSATRPSCSPGSASSSACRPGARRGSTSTRARTTAPGSASGLLLRDRPCDERPARAGARRSASSARRA